MSYYNPEEDELLEEWAEQFKSDPITAEAALLREMQNIRRDFKLNQHELTMIIIKNLQKVMTDSD